MKVTSTSEHAEITRHFEITDRGRGDGVNTYLVKIDYAFDNEIKEHRIFADTPTEAVLIAGWIAGNESGGPMDSFKLLSIEEVVETKKRVWG